MSPLIKPVYPFVIWIKSNEYRQFANKEVINKFSVNTAHHYILDSIDVDGEQLQQYLFFDEKKENW